MFRSTYFEIAGSTQCEQKHTLHTLYYSPVQIIEFRCSNPFYTQMYKIKHTGMWATKVGHVASQSGVQWMVTPIVCRVTPYRPPNLMWLDDCLMEEVSMAELHHITNNAMRRTQRCKALDCRAVEVL